MRLCRVRRYNLTSNVCACEQIKTGDGLPGLICAECVARINAAHAFRQQIRKNDAELRESLARTKDENDDFGTDAVETEPATVKLRRRKRRKNVVCGERLVLKMLGKVLVVV